MQKWEYQTVSWSFVPGLGERQASAYVMLTAYCSASPPVATWAWKPSMVPSCMSI